MRVFRISSARWIESLNGSGRAARWNSNGVFICYVAANRALACLEMIVHLSGEQLKIPFKIAEIDIPDEVIDKSVLYLPLDWHNYESYSFTQEIGDEWTKSNIFCVKRVPSAIIENEFNFLINPQHIDNNKISIIKIEDFHFDSRLV